MNDIILFVKNYSIIPMAVVFLGLMATVLWPGRRKRYDDDAQIPFRNDHVHDEH